LRSRDSADAESAVEPHSAKPFTAADEDGGVSHDGEVDGYPFRTFFPPGSSAEGPLCLRSSKSIKPAPKGYSRCRSAPMHRASPPKSSNSRFKRPRRVALPTALRFLFPRDSWGPRAHAHRSSVTNERIISLGVCSPNPNTGNKKFRRATHETNTTFS